MIITKREMVYPHITFKKATQYNNYSLIADRYVSSLYANVGFNVRGKLYLYLFH